MARGFQSKPAQHRQRHTKDPQDFRLFARMESGKLGCGHNARVRRNHLVSDGRQTYQEEKGSTREPGLTGNPSQKLSRNLRFVFSTCKRSCQLSSAPQASAASISIAEWHSGMGDAMSSADFLQMFFREHSTASTSTLGRQTVHTLTDTAWVLLRRGVSLLHNRPTEAEVFKRVLKRFNEQS